jgi:uncharacterized protein YabE (DUF348 family)
VDPASSQRLTRRGLMLALIQLGKAGLWLVGAGALCGLLLAGYRATGTRSWVEVEGLPSRQIFSHAATVAGVLREAGIDLMPEDACVPPPGASVQPDLRIRIRRARPVVIQADGNTHSLRSQAATIAELLAELDLRLKPQDEVWLNGTLSTPATALLPAGPVGREAAPARNLPAAGATQVVIRRAVPITVNDDGTPMTFYATAATVGEVLQQHQITIYLGDRVLPGLGSPVAAGMQVFIRRSVPVHLYADGRWIHTRTQAETVAGVLAQEGLALVGKDQIDPPLTAALAPGLEIRVTRVREELLVEQEPIPFEAVWVGDPELEIDQQRLVQDGRVGLYKRRYRLVFQDDLQVSRALEDEWTAQEPADRVMAYGQKIVIRTLDTPDGPIEYWRKMRVYTTSYTAASSGKPRDHPRYGYTRLGHLLRKGIVAVDPEVIPLRTRLYVPGYGVAFAGDTGGGVKGKMVDLGYEQDTYQSWHWWTDVYILTPVPPASQIRWVLPDWPRYPDRRR